jgi:hypothetical protein
MRNRAGRLLGLAASNDAQGFLLKRRDALSAIPQRGPELHSEFARQAALQRRARRSVRPDVVVGREREVALA